MTVTTTIRASVSLCVIAMWLLWSSGCAHRSSTIEPQRWRVKGTITSIQNRTLEVRHKSGQTVTLVLDDRTTYSRGKEQADMQSLARGARVTIEVELRDGAHHARHVRIGNGARTPAPVASR